MHLLTLAALVLAAPAEPLALKGHTDTINAVAFSPDGALVVTASADKTARVWDAKTGKELAVLKGHSGPVTGVGVSPNGKLLVTAGYGPKPEGKDPQTGEIKLWDVPDFTTGKDVALRKDLEKVDLAVDAIVFDPNGRRVTANCGKYVFAWEVASGERKVAFIGHTDTVTGLAYDPGGARLVTAGSDGTVRVWHPDTGKLVHTLKGHQGQVLAVAVTPKLRAVTGGQDMSVRVWGVEDGKEEQKFSAHLAPVLSVAAMPGGKGRVASASGLEPLVRIWDVEAGKELTAVKLPKDAKGPYRVALSADGKRLAVATLDRTVRVFDLPPE